MDNRPEHPQLRLHPLLLLAVAIAATQLLGWMIPMPFISELPARVLGLVLFLGSLVIGFPAFRAMLKARTTLDPIRPSAALVQGGTYRLTRNPMYLSMLVAYAGLFVFLGNMWFVPALPILFWLFTIGVIVPEELYLQHRFGDDYARFTARVPRWI